ADAEGEHEAVTTELDRLEVPALRPADPGENGTKPVANLVVGRFASARFAGRLSLVDVSEIHRRDGQQLLAPRLRLDGEMFGGDLQRLLRPLVSGDEVIGVQRAEAKSNQGKDDPSVVAVLPGELQRLSPCRLRLLQAGLVSLSRLEANKRPHPMPWVGELAEERGCFVGDLLCPGPVAEQGCRPRERK